MTTTELLKKLADQIEKAIKIEQESPQGERMTGEQALNQMLFVITLLKGSV